MLYKNDASLLENGTFFKKNGKSMMKHGIVLTRNVVSLTNHHAMGLKNHGYGKTWCHFWTSDSDNIQNSHDFETADRRFTRRGRAEGPAME